MKKIILLLIIILLTVPTLAAAEEEFVIGLIPEENIFRQVKRHKPLEAYLSNKLGIKVRFTILSRYPHIINRFISRNLDGAFFGILTAVLAQEDLPVEPIARPVKIEGGTTARGVIFVRKDSGIKTVNDLRNHRAAFVDNVTATGYLFMLAYLRQNGIYSIDKFFSEYYFTGSHDTTVYTVYAGRADIGTVKERIFNKLSEKDPVIKDELVIIATSDELPDNTLCIKSTLPQELKNKLKKALLTMHLDPEGQKVLKELEAVRFAPASFEDFEPVRTLAKKAGINLKNYKY
jgi:phosphonate transport system substrate-binding protein